MAILATDIRNWTIYKLVNPENQVYIGCTSVFKARMSHYRTLGGKCEKQRFLYQSLLKYGFNGHIVSVLDQFKSNKLYAEGKEIFWIKTYMSNAVKYPEIKGLNLADGGQGSLGMKIIGRQSAFKGKHHTEESKKMLSEYGKMNPSRGMLGKKMSEDSKKKMSENKKGKPSPHIGRKHTLQAILNNSKSKIGKPSANKGRKISKEMKDRMALTRNTKRQSVIIEKDGVEQEFRSIIAAYTFLGIGASLFKRIANGLFDYKFNGYFIKLKI